MPAPIRVLYVGDDHTAMERCRAHLDRTRNFDFQVATSGHQALERLDDPGSIDCVLIRLAVPGMDAIEFVRSMREQDPDLPLLVVTDEVDDAVSDGALESESTEYVPAPLTAVTGRWLRHRIREVTGRSRQPNRSGGTIVDDSAVARMSKSVPDFEWGSHGGASPQERGGQSRGDRDGADGTSATMQAHSVLPVDRLACPVPDCPFEATSQAGLRRHLLDESGDADVNAVLHAAVHARLGGDDTPAKADHDESSGTSTTTAEADAVPAEASPEWEGTDPPRDVVDGTDPLYGIARALGVEGRNDMEREHLVDAINERIDTAIRAPESAGSAEASPETSTFAGVVEPNSLARSEDDRTETYDVGPEREENRADTSDAAHSLVVALRELLEEIANVDTGRSPTETDAAVSEADRSPSETTPTGGTGAEPEPSEPDVADPGASADVSADEMAASDAIGNQVVPSGPSSEKSSSPEEIEALITDFEEERGGTTLLLSETHDESQRSFCDHALGVDEVNDRNVLLFRSRRLHTGELEHIAGSANTVRLLTLGYQPNVPSSVSDIVDATFVDHPDDLRRLGIIATRTIDEWHGEGAEIRVCFDSLSVMLRYVDEQQLFRFLHLLFSKLDNADAVTHCHLDPTSEESRVVGILRPLFDSVIELSGDPTDEEP